MWGQQRVERKAVEWEGSTQQVWLQDRPVWDSQHTWKETRSWVRSSNLSSCVHNRKLWPRLQGGIPEAVGEIFIGGLAPMGSFWVDGKERISQAMQRDNTRERAHVGPRRAWSPCPEEWSWLGGRMPAIGEAEMRKAVEQRRRGHSEVTGGVSTQSRE